MLPIPKWALRWWVREDAAKFAGRGKGKSGGYRTIHFNGADDVPVLLLVILDKGERDNISHAERNELKKALATYEQEYRAGAARRAKSERRT